MAHDRGPVHAPARPDREARRHALLEAAAAEFNARGVSRASISRIAKAKGLTRAAVYYYVRDRDDLVAWLRGRGLKVADSDANFVLFGTFEDRHKVWQSLLDRSVLIRETGPAGWLRVSVGTAQEMSAFRDALTEVLGQ